MQKISKIEKTLQNIQEYHSKHKKIFDITTIFIDVLVVIYYFSFVVILIPGLIDVAMKYERLWYDVLYATVNPYTTGAYILGLIVLYHYIVYKSIILKVSISIYYSYIILISLIALMGCENPSDLLMYLPHVIIIALCIIVACKQRKLKHFV